MQEPRAPSNHEGGVSGPRDKALHSWVPCGMALRLVRQEGTQTSPLSSPFTAKAQGNWVTRWAGLLSPGRLWPPSPQPPSPHLPLAGWALPWLPE